jgi:sugar lactone lactonase YvrE
MGLGAETGAGAIYRHYGGEVRQLFDRVSIPNAISFTPERSHAHFADSKAGKVWRVRLEPADGWPVGEAELFLDYAGRQSAPDGAVCDAASNLWIAEWGAGRVAGYGKDGREIGHVAVAGRHSSCPAFGGPDLTTLFVTTAREHMTEADIAAEPRNGCVFRTEGAGRGLPEPVVVL